MRPRHLLFPLALAACLSVVALAAAATRSDDGPRPAQRAAAVEAASAIPVRKFKTSAFGTVLVTRKYQALYYWTPEKRNPGKILCTGRCARAWPPLIVKKGTVIPRKVAGFKGVFGTIRRPDGRRQLTYNRLPLYTYAHEGPRQVLCNNVDGWFVARV
jgi:predicted lipoprotein with Yx(FWY)xxD motif